MEDKEWESMDLDDDKTVEFIQHYLPQDLQGKYSDDELHYFIDLIDDYYSQCGVLDSKPDADGYVNIDLEKVAAYLVQESAKDGMGEYDPDEIFFVVQGEMEYFDQLAEE